MRSIPSNYDKSEFLCSAVGHKSARALHDESRSAAISAQDARKIRKLVALLDSVFEHVVLRLPPGASFFKGSLTVRIQHARNIEILLGDVKRGVQVLEWVVLKGNTNLVLISIA